MSIAKVVAPTPALIAKVAVNEGDKVKVGDIIAILNVMKTEVPIKAKIGGVVKEINVKCEELVEMGGVIALIESETI